jgi:hypothetical protein
MYYGFRDLETQQMRNSPHITAKRAEFIKKGCPNNFDMGQPTEGSWQALSDGNGTEFQVGGYIGNASTVNGVTTFTLTNPETFASLTGLSYYGRIHGSPGIQHFWSHARGPMHDVTQTFQWQESGLCGD